MTKKINILLMSAISILLCSILLVTGTYALFSDEVTVTNHLQAGELEATLTRVSVNARKLDMDATSATYGRLINQQIYEDVVLDDTTSADLNAFGFEKNETIVPTGYSEATFVIENKGNVAFGYYVEIKNFTGDNTFAGMIEVSVMTGRTVETVENKGYELVANSQFVPEKTVTLSGLSNDTIALGDKNKFLGEVSLTAATQAFTVKIAFADKTNNNEAENKTANFDIVVYAVQLT